MRREALYLSDIVEAADEIAKYLSDTDETSFLTNTIRQSAVAFQLAIIGEAVANLPDDLRTRYPDVEWRAARGLRNIIVHSYFAINWTIIWETATADVPLLREQITAILDNEFPEMPST